MNAEQGAALEFHSAALREIQSARGRSCRTCFVNAIYARTFPIKALLAI